MFIRLYCRSIAVRHQSPQPFLRGDEVTAAPIILMDPGRDPGPILSQKKVPISEEDTTGSLRAKLSQVGAQLLIETLPLWIEGRINPQPQDEGRASYSRMIKKEDGEIDWRLTTQELWRRIRAFDPWPGSFTTWRGNRLKLIKVTPIYDERYGEPGKVVALAPPHTVSVGVQTGDGVLGLVRVQLEGKRELSAEEFVRGQRDFIGSLLL